MRRPPTLNKPTTAAAPAPAPAPVAVAENQGSPANYLSFYGLSKPPFDEGDFIHFGSHKRSYEALIDHLINGAGTVLLQGEEGSGKTQILESAAKIAAESGVQTILVPRPSTGRISQAQLIAAISALDATPEESVERFLAPPRKVLLVDDFDLMPDDCVRLLSSLMRQLPSEPPGPVVVLSSSSGLPSGVGRSSAPKPETLPVITILIPRLGPTDVQQYIERALWASGGTTRRLIESDAIRMLTARSGGVPAVVNRLVDAAFITGFARRDAMITTKTVAAAMDDPSPGPVQRSRKPPVVTENALKMVAIGLLVLGASAFLYRGLTGQPEHPTAASLSDIAEMRQAYQHSADAGDATAATALAKTYDPNYAPPGSTPDAAKAADWYQKAIALGDPQADNLLKRLGAH